MNSRPTVGCEAIERVPAGLDALRALSDCDVVSSLDRLAERDRKTGAAIVAHLVIVRERSIHRRRGQAGARAPRGARLAGRRGHDSFRHDPRRVPAATPRAAYAKSDGRCQYVSPDGRRCPARAFLELDHVVPRAMGGDHQSVRILCRAHNQRAAELSLGTAHMETARRRARRCRDVTEALKGLGFAPGVARQAAEDALDQLGTGIEGCDSRGAIPPHHRRACCARAPYREP